MTQPLHESEASKEDLDAFNVQPFPDAEVHDDGKDPEDSEPRTPAGSDPFAESS